MKKLLIFLMVLIPLVVIFIVNVTVDIVGGVVSISVDNITIDQENYIANINEPLKLNAKIQPEGASDKTILWSSSDENIATVDSEGNVTFHAFGAVDIIATSGDGLKKATCRINVTDVRVHDIEIFAEKTSLTLGETTLIWASVIPSTAENQQYVLRSSNENVISINASGVATANNVGTAIITATSYDGNYEASIAINVTIPVTSVNLIPEEEQITIASSSLLLNYEILPLNATNRQVVFSSSDPSTATVDNNGRINFLKTGSVIITVTTQDGNFSDNVKINYTGGYPISLELENKEMQFDISDGNKNMQINYTLSPSDTIIKNILFTSNNTNVAVVNQTGLVKIIGGGTATITVKIQTSEDTFIFDSILINVSRDITSLTFDNNNLITAINNIVLTPNIYPADATNYDNISYEIIEGTCATINENGELNFSDAGTVKVKVYLQNNPDINTTIDVTYTNGYPYSVDKVEGEITINAGENGALNFILNPTGVTIRNYTFSIVESSPINAGDTVITLDATSGRFTAISGGLAIVRLYVKTSETSEISTDYIIHVNKKAEDIEFNIDEEIFENSFVTGVNEVIFDAKVLPLDATENELIYSISNSSIAKILGNKIHFNQAGKITLTATLKSNNQITKSVSIWYTGGYAISASISNLPEKLIADDASFDISLNNIVPANASNKSFSISLSNQQSIYDNVLIVSYNSNSTLASITPVNAGTLTFSVILAGSTSPIFSESLKIERKVEKIEFLTVSGETPNTEIELLCNVLPIDATNRQVTFSLSEIYSEIAYISNNKLIFKNSSNDKETVIVTASLVDIDGIVKTADITITSTFGKIIAPEGNEITLAPSNQVEYDYSSDVISGYDLTFVVKKGQDIINAEIVNNKLIINALQVGQAEIEVQLVETSSQNLFKILADITITIAEKITNIAIESDDLDFYNNRYYTGIDIIDLNILLTPVTSSLNDIKVTISDNSIANFDLENQQLQFLKTGIVEITISTLDNQLSKKFVIQYTNGSSINSQFNLNEENNNISLNTKSEIKLISFIPHNVNLQIVEITEILQSGNNEILLIENINGVYYFTAKESGKTNLQVKLSDGTIKIFPISIASYIENISFAQEEIITANTTYTLNPILTPTNPTNKNLIFESSNAEIATVSSSGIITFHRKGSVVITVYSEENPSISATITITSTFGEISDFNLNFTKLNLVVGEMRILSPNSIYPIDASMPVFRYEIIYSDVNNVHSGYNVITLNNGTITAEHGGTAIIKVYVILADGSEVYKTCEIEVEQALTSIDVELNEDLDTYQNYFVTSREEIEFNIITSPFDATIKNLKITVDDETIAVINGTKIIFKNEGLIKLTIEIDGLTKTLSIRHTKTAISFEIENISGSLSGNIRTIELNVNNSLILNPINIIPSDIIEKEISLTLLLNSPNCIGDLVCEISENTIYTKKGGKARFKVEVAGKESNEILEIVVIQKATEIIVNENILTSKEKFSLNAELSPADATNPVLKYNIISGSNIATISDIGIVEFLDEGTIQVEIKNEFSNLTKTITITFSHGIKTIEFDNAPDYIFIGKTLQLSTIISPDNIKDEEVVWSIIQGSDLATISQTGLITPKKREGTITIKIQLKNYPDVVATKTIQIYAIITDINMDEDASDDKQGIAEERLFGNQFPHVIDNKIIYDNTFKLGFTMVHNCEVMPQLSFRSSNEQVATVSSDGTVTVLKPGKVTISVYPMKQIGNDPSKYVYDSYKYTFINARNIYDIKGLQDFCLYNKQENEEFAGVIQNDLTAPIGEKLPYYFSNKTLYGNGHLLNLNNGENKNNISVTLGSNSLLRNIQIRSYNFSAGESVVKLETVHAPLIIDFKSQNVNIEYCILESGVRDCEVLNASVNFKGCIFQNSFNAGVLLQSRDKNYPNIANFDSCIFENNMLGTVSNTTTNEELSKTPCIVTFDGFADFYNWQPLSLLNELNLADRDNALMQAFNSVINDMLKTILNKYDYLFKTYNGEKYVHLGFLSLEADIMFEGKGIKVYDNSKVTFNTANNPYSFQKMQENILTGTMALKTYGLSATSNNSIQPGTSYKDNVKAAYEKIRRSLARL